VTGRPRPLGRLADLVVFAPLGFLLEAPRLVPELAQTGRRTLLGCRRGGPSGTAEATTAPGPARRPAAGPRPIDTDLVDPVEEVIIAVEREDELDDGDSGGLPIPGYDQLAASQVIARLPGLSAPELDRIEDHESSHRRRRTVLAKISQLRA
jgi:hypothetical protein